MRALFPNIAAEWHPEKNGDLRPEDVRPGSGKRVWWLCAVDPHHEWETKILHRVLAGSGCPFCSIVPRSRQEIVLACELLAFVDFDVSEHKVTALGRMFDVDIIMPTLNLVVEFDGWYWHQEKVETDAEKADMLVKAGWRVIRAREEPLEVIGPNDVVVPQGDLKAMADRVLLQIQEVCDVELEGLDAYLRSKSLVNIAKAETLVKKLLAERAKMESESAPSQRLLFSLDGD